MMAMGGRVNGGLYGTAPRSRRIPETRRSRTTPADVRFETDFRSVYAQVIDNWLGADSGRMLGGDFRNPSSDLHLNSDWSARHLSGHRIR